MSPCTEQSRKSIHCMGRKRRIFTLLTLRILLTALSSGIIANSIPAWKAMMREPGARWVPTIYLHSFLGWLEACVCASPSAQDQGELSLPLNPPLISHVFTPQKLFWGLQISAVAPSFVSMAMLSRWSVLGSTGVDVCNRGRGREFTSATQEEKQYRGEKKPFFFNLSSKAFKNL